MENESNLGEILNFEVRLMYDFQRLRLQSGGRIQKRATEIYQEGPQLERIKAAHKALHDLELDRLDVVKTILKEMDIWNAWLKNVKGIGPSMGGVLLGCFDIEIATTVSKMWRYGGLAVVDGKSERPKKGTKLGYDPFLKSKLLGVLGPSFLRALVKKCQEHKEAKTVGVNCPACEYQDYAKVYADYRHRWESAGKGKSDGHRHNAAIRYMVKMFLIDLYREWREIEGLLFRMARFLFWISNLRGSLWTMGS